MSIQNKISLVFTALSGSIIVLLSIFIYVLSKESTYDMFFHRLEVRASIIGHAYLEDDEASTSVYHIVRDQHLKRLPEENHYIIDLTEMGEVLESDKPALPLGRDFYSAMLLDKSVRHFSNEVFYVGTVIESSQGAIAVVSEAVDTLGLEELAYLKKLLVVGFVGCILITYTVGRIFSTQVFRPVRDIITKVKGISAHNLDQRLEAGQGQDEIADLATTFNSMLARLSITFEMQNNFISNASHEFKTPLTIIAGEAELALEHPGTDKPLAQSLYKITQESEKLKELIDGMLAIAQTGFDGQAQQWGVVRLDEIILAVKNTINKIHADNKVDIDYSTLPENNERLCIEGNSALLRVALTNIVMNACKYSDNREVTIKVAADEKRIYVQVSDKGIGIPERELPQIFVPFFRASNTHSYEGHGVGLPLANNIIRMHHGHMNVKSKVGEGTTVIVYLPHLQQHSV